MTEANGFIFVRILCFLWKKGDVCKENLQALLRIKSVYIVRQGLANNLVMIMYPLLIISCNPARKKAETEDKMKPGNKKNLAGEA